MKNPEKINDGMDTVLETAKLVDERKKIIDGLLDRFPDLQKKYTANKEVLQMLTGLKLHIDILKVQERVARNWNNIELEESNLARAKALKKIIDLLSTDNINEAQKVFENYIKARNKEDADRDKHLEELRKQEIAKMSPEEKKGNLKAIKNRIENLEREKQKLLESME